MPQLNGEINVNTERWPLNNYFTLNIIPSTSNIDYVVPQKQTEMGRTEDKHPTMQFPWVRHMFILNGMYKALWHSDYAPHWERVYHLLYTKVAAEARIGWACCPITWVADGRAGNGSQVLATRSRFPLTIPNGDKENPLLFDLLEIHMVMK